MSDDRALLEKIKRFTARVGMTDSAFGRAAIKDANLIPQMSDAKKPRSLTGRTRTKVEKFMETYRGA